MKRLLLSFCVLILFLKESNSQTHIELGLQKNFLQQKAEFNSLGSVLLHCGIGYDVNAKIPLYFGANLDYFYAYDKLISANSYGGTLIGLNLGFRPIAKKWVKPIQPFFETNLNFNIGDSTHTLKKIWNYGGGIELYFTKKSCFVISYLNEHYMFKNAIVTNGALRVCLRMTIANNPNNQ